MPIRRKPDSPGQWWHITNRALARRTFFETRADIDEFCAQLERVVGRGQLEVHAFTMLTTHFHLLVRSPVGEVSVAMRDAQLGYVRYFNRSRRRDGPLVRGRFKSRPVDSHRYRITVVGYIDRNPVQAGLAAHAGAYEYGSAWHYLRADGPTWLSRDWVEGHVRCEMGLERFEPESYRDVFRTGFVGGETDGRAWLVERRLQCEPSDGEPDPTDSLLDGAAPAVLDWMRRKAALADGTRPGRPVVPPSELLRLLASPGRVDRRRRRDRGDELLLLCHLLRDCSGLTFAEVGRIIGASAGTARREVAAGRERVAEDRGYAVRLASLAHAALEATYRDCVYRTRSDRHSPRGQSV